MLLLSMLNCFLMMVFLVVNGDDKNCLDLYKYTDAKKMSYSILNKEADFYADNIVFNDEWLPYF